MELSISFPLDGNFLRRQCPSCRRQFKWHNGPVDDRPQDAVDPFEYYCPYCGHTAGNDDWWTEEQLELAQQTFEAEATSLLDDQMSAMARKFRKGPVTMKYTGSASKATPRSLLEPSDMIELASPCHPWEPMKILEDWASPVHCLVCGRNFAIS